MNHSEHRPGTSPVETPPGILLVDDTPSDLVALRKMLDDVYPTLANAKSGEDAIAQLKAGEFAVVLLKVRMSGMSGFETAQAMRSDARLRHTPIMFLAEEEATRPELEQAYAFGAVDFLAKPLIPVMLRAKIDGYIEMFEKTQQIRLHAEQLLVDERQRLAPSMAEHPEWMRVTLSSIGDAVITTDTQQRVTFLNPVAQQLTGWTQAEALGKPLEMVFPIVNEQNRKPVENPVEKVLREGIIVGLANHTVLLARNGSERPIDDSAAPIRDASGEIIGVVLIFRDVTEQKQAEREVRQSEARKSAILETALDCIVTMDHEGKVVEFNPAAEKTFGYRRADVIGQELADLIIPPSLRERHRRGMAHYLATGEGPVLGKRIELLAQRADGTEFPVELAITRIPIDGPPLFTAYLRDVSEKQQAERQLEERVVERTAELARANEFLKALLENVQTGVVACDAAGVLTLFNGVTRALHGLPEEPIPPEQWAARYRLYRPDGQTPMEKNDVPLYRALQGERVHETEMVIAARGAPPKTVVTSGQAIFDAQGEKLGAVVSMQDITARKHAEMALIEAHDQLEQRVQERTEELGQANAALKESEGKLRLLADTIPQLAWMARPDGHIFWYNRRWYEYTGTTPEQMEGWGWQRVHDPDTLPNVIERWKKSIDSGEPFDMEFPLKSAEGEFRIFLTRVNPLKDGDGQVLYWFGTNTDIAELRDARAALASSEERLRLALDAGRMGVWDWNIRTGELKWSESLEPLHGLAPGTFGGTIEHFQQLIHPDDREMASTSIRQALESCGEYYIEFRNQRPSGGIHWIAGSGRVFAGEDGKPLRMLGIGLDVTQRKRAEQTARFLSDASAALAQLVDFDSTLQKISSLAVPYFADWATVDLIEPDGSLRRVSVSHIDKAKVQLAHEVHRRFPPDPMAPMGVWNILRTGRSELVPEITDDMLVASIKDDEHLGSIRQLGLKCYIGVPLIVRGKTIGVITFINAESEHCYDETDLAMAEDLASRAGIAIENAQLYRDLRDADRRKDEFLATLAHELRNPLAPLRNAINIRRMTNNPDPLQPVMERQVALLVRLIDDLLDVSRINLDKLTLKRAPTTLQRVLEAALEIASPLIEKGSHPIVRDIPADALPLDADQDRLSQVFSNLLGNAAKYSSAGTAIEISVSTTNSHVRTTIRDHGIGLAAAQCERVFELFNQVDTSIERSQGGLGIGLSLVRKLVDLHGGVVHAQSDGLGQGSCFTVELPLGETLPLPTERLYSTPLAKGRRALVVDDNRDAADTLALALQVFGLQVRTLYDPLQATDVATSYDPHLVFLDIGMPGLSGYDLARRLREAQPDRSPVLVAVTGWGQPEDQRRTADAGFDHHLVKPPDLDVLRAICASVIP